MSFLLQTSSGDLREPRPFWIDWYASLGHWKHVGTSGDVGSTQYHRSRLLDLEARGSAGSAMSRSDEERRRKILKTSNFQDLLPGCMLCSTPLLLASRSSRRLRCPLVAQRRTMSPVSQGCIPIDPEGSGPSQTAKAVCNKNDNTF